MQRRSISACLSALALAVLGGAAPVLAVPVAAPQNAPLPTWQARGRVSALAIANGIVYLGGSFTRLESHGTRRTIPRMHLAAINEATGVPTAWNPGVNGPVQVIRVIGKRVYVGGRFTSIGGSNVRNLAAVGRGGGRVIAGFRASANGTVDALAASGKTLYVGGSFSAVDGSARGNLGAVALGSGALNTSWRVTANGTVHTLLDAHSLKRVFIGGKFTRIDGVSRTDLASVGEKLGTLRTWASAPLGQVWSLALGGSSALYAAVGGHEGGQLDSFNPGSGALRWNRFADGDVQAVSVTGNTVFSRGSARRPCRASGSSPLVHAERCCPGTRPVTASTACGRCAATWATSSPAATSPSSTACTRPGSPSSCVRRSTWRWWLGGRRAWCSHRSRPSGLVVSRPVAAGWGHRSPPENTMGDEQCPP